MKHKLVFYFILIFGCNSFAQSRLYLQPEISICYSTSNDFIYLFKPMKKLGLNIGFQGMKSNLFFNLNYSLSNPRNLVTSGAAYTEFYKLYQTQTFLGLGKIWKLNKSFSTEVDGLTGYSFIASKGSRFSDTLTDKGFLIGNNLKLNFLINKRISIEAFNRIEYLPSISNNDFKFYKKPFTLNLFAGISLKWFIVKL